MARRVMRRASVKEQRKRLIDLREKLLLAPAQ